MTEHQFEQQAAAVEGAIAGHLRCDHCKRWRDRAHMFKRSRYPWSEQKCVDETDCKLVRHQQHAANAIARQMLGEWFRAQEGR